MYVKDQMKGFASEQAFLDNFAVVMDRVYQADSI